MKGGGHLFCIFFLGLAWIKPFLSVVPIQLDFENICHHQFSQGCPVHDSDSWKCAKMWANCPGDQLLHYHCIRNTTGETFTVIHICASLLKCSKGTVPIYDTRKRALSCVLCPSGFYQPADAWSDETPECLQKHTCEKEGNKIECDMGSGLHNIQDVYCRCDARNNYVLTYWERRGMCVEWADATCYFNRCPDGQERLLNYSCSPQCDKGQKRDNNDICVPIGATSITTTAINGNKTVTEEASPKTSTTPFAPTSVAEKFPVEIISDDIFTIKVIISAVSSVLFIIGVLLLVCWKCKQCVWSRKPTNKQSISDALHETELKDLTKDTNADADTSVETCLQDRTNGGCTVVLNIMGNAQFGPNNTMCILKPTDKGDTADIDEDANNSTWPAESNASSSGKQGIKEVNVDKEQSHPDIIPADCPGNFRKICDETDAIYNMELIVEVAKSVGIIRASGIQGTGFRIGKSYIMTALHVVTNIINSGVPPVTGGEGEPNLKILEDPNVHIDFDYKLPNDASDQGQRRTLRFSFESTICYASDELDTAVLKLKHHASDFPHQLTRFGHCLMNLPIIFVGHSEGKVKQCDKSKPREDVTSSKIQECQAWSKQHQVGCREKYHGYEGADNQKKILFDCTFSKGASGSPGFIISSLDHMPYVVTMLLCGYPDWFYDDKVSKKEKTGFQNGYTFEQGVCLTEVYKDMKLHKPELCLEIFGS